MRSNYESFIQTPDQSTRRRREELVHGGELEEMRIRIRDPGAFGQQLRRDAIKEQLDREPIARREAGSFASPALTISAGADELDARSERERLP